MKYIILLTISYVPPKILPIKSVPRIPIAPQLSAPIIAKIKATFFTYITPQELNFYKVHNSCV